MTAVKKRIAHLRKKGHAQLAGLRQRCSAGAAWTEQRRREAGYAEEPWCPRCRPAEESPLHRMWWCPCNTKEALAELGEDGLHAGMLETTNDMTAQAVEQCGHQSFWLGGRTPTPWTMPTEEEAAQYEGDTFLQSTMQEDGLTWFGLKSRKPSSMAVGMTKANG